MASPQAIADACTYLYKVYGERARSLLGDDLAKEILFDDLRNFTDQEVKKGVEMMRLGQENVFADGQSIYAIVLKWVKKGRRAARRDRAYQGRIEEDERRNAEMRELASKLTPEKMAINKLRIKMLANGETERAARLSSLPEGEQMKLVPRSMLDDARRMWKAAHRGRYARVANSMSQRLDPSHPCPMIPDTTGGSE